MGAWGYALAGLAQGLGGGLVAMGQQQQQERASEAAYRREVALQNLRAQNATDLSDRQHGQKLSEIKETAVQDDWKDARKTARTTDSTIKIDRERTNNDIRVVGAKKDADAFLTRMKSDLDQRNDAAALRLKAAIDGGQVDSVVPGEDGNYRVIYKSGRIEDAGFRAAPKELVGGRSSGGGGILDRARGDDEPGTYTPGQGPRTNQPAKAVTRAQVAEFAKERGMTPAQAEKWARDNGFTIQ